MKALVPENRRSGGSPLRVSSLYPLVCVPVMILIAAAIAGCGEAEEQSARETPSALTPVATTAAPSASDAPPPEGGKAPDGCLQGEKAYVDPEGRFAFCYLEGMGIATVDTDDGFGVTAMHPLEQDNRVIVNVVWTTIARLGWVDIAPCIDSPEIIKNRELRPITIDGVTVEACFQDHYDPLDPDLLKYQTIQAEVPATDDSVVRYNIAITGPDFVRDGKPSEDLAQRVIDSSVIDVEGSS